MSGTFSYAGTAAGSAITTARDKVRLEIGDTDSTAVLYYDEEIDVYLAARSNAVLMTAADLCDAAATKFARAYNFETDGQKYARGQMVKAFQDRARELRRRAEGVATVVTTKVDGYSDDITSEEVLTSGESPRRRYYGEQDRLP